jgi:uncharacterized protein (DUF1330 family)
MPAYCLFQNLRITNPSLMEDYVRQVKPITESFGGQYIVMGGQVDVKEGEWAPVFPVMIEFPTMEAANAWYNSPDYAPLKDLRLSAGEFSAVFIEGVPAR